MRAAALAYQLGGKRSGHQWLCKCPAHDDHDPSLIVFDGRENVQVRCLSGCEQREVINALVQRRLWPGVTSGDDGQERANNVSRQTNDSEADRLADVREQRRLHQLALAIWGKADDARNTLGEMYLWDRKLELPPQAHGVVRFSRLCPRGADRVPALIVLMRDVETSQPMAIQRIFLSQRAVKDGKPQMLGPARNCAMMTVSWQRTFWDDLSYCPRLFVCEGFETSLALLRDGYSPVWACGDAIHIRLLPVLFGVGQLVICADNDLPGISAAEACKMRWGDKAVIRKRAEAGKDFADD